MIRRQGEKLLDKKFLLVGCVLFMLVFANILTFLLVRFDQFNVFHKYDSSYSIYDWNLPHIVTEFIDNDNQKDTVMYTGCVFLSTVTPSNIPVARQCRNNVVGDGKMVGNQIPILNKKLINAYLGRRDESWDIVVHYLGETSLFKISPSGELIEEIVPVTLKLDSFLYSLTHLYAIVF